MAKGEATDTAKGRKADWLRVKAKREKWDATFRKIGEIALPGSAGLHTTANASSQRGETRGANVFDTVGAEALSERSATIIGKLFPPGQPWMQAEHSVPADLDQDTMEQIKGHAEDAAAKFMLAIQRSNFDMEISQSMDEALISTSAIILHMNDYGSSSPFRFEVIPLRQLYAEEGRTSRLTRIFFPRQIRAGDIMATWPAAKVHRNLQKIIEETPGTEVTLHDCFEPAGDNDEGSEYELWDFTNDFKMLDDAYEVSPVIAYRFSKDPGEDMGRGPVMQCAPNMYTANTAKKLVLKNAHLQIEGIWNLVETGTDTFDVRKIRPGVVIQTTNPQGGLKRVDVGGRLDIAEFVVASLHESIRKTIMGPDLPAAEEGVRTAHEWAVRAQRNAQVEIPTTLRLVVELVMPLGRRGLHILQHPQWAGDATFGVTPLMIGNEESRKTLMPSMRNPIMKLYEQAESANLLTKITETQQVFGEARAAGIYRMNATARLIAQKGGIPTEAFRPVQITNAMDEAEGQEVTRAIVASLMGQAGGQPGQPDAPPPDAA